MSIVYGILPVSVSKGYNKVYNKQMIVGKYERTYKPTTNNRQIYNLKLLELIPITGTQKQADSKRSSFDCFTSYNKIQYDVENIKVITGINSSVEFFDTFELAKLAKYVYMDSIRIYFDEHLKAIKNTMEANLPKNMDEEIQAIYDEMPEYLL